MSKKVTLYSTEGGADKQYTIWIEPHGSLYTVEAQWGRRGGPVQSGTKTPKAVSREKAEEVYEKTLKEKRAKGYHEGEDAPAFSQVDNAVDSGLRPMLLTDATDVGPAQFIDDDLWCAQEKLNGKRIMLKSHDGCVIGVNRKGLECPIPKVVIERFTKKAGIYDGELVGEEYTVFDALSTPKSPELHKMPYAERLAAAVIWIGGKDPTLRVSIGRLAKAALVAKLQNQRKEGIVFKRMDATYQPGKIENLQKAIAVKVKFYAEGLFLVVKWNDKQSVEIAALNTFEGMKNESAFRRVGNVTVATKYVDQIKPGKVIRVRYLYATPNHILYQPNLDPTDDGIVCPDDALPANATKWEELKFEGKDE